MKPQLVMVMAILTTFLLCGCISSKPTIDAAQAATPEDAISGMITALKTADGTLLNSLIQYQQTKKNGVIVETERFWSGVLDAESKAYMLAVFEGLDYTILSSDRQTDTEESLTLEISNKDLSKINSLDYADSDDFLTDEAKAIKKITETVTKKVEVNLIKSETSWQVVIDDELRSALLGNKTGILDDLRDMLPW